MSQTKIFIYVLGGPGCGKSTQCSKIVEENDSWDHLSTGDLLRKEVREGSDIGLKCKKVMNEGKMVLKEHVLEVLSKNAKISSKTKLIIDGYPEGYQQITDLEKLIGNFIYAIHYNCDENILLERIQRRSKKTHRKDDDAKTARIRYIEYLKQTGPLLKTLKKKNKLIEINGNDDIDVVYGKTKGAIEKIIRMEEIDWTELFEKNWFNN